MIRRFTVYFKFGGKKQRNLIQSLSRQGNTNIDRYHDLGFFHKESKVYNFFSD